MSSKSVSKAWFIGPKAENQEVLEQLVVESLRDYCYWRKNFHPEDQTYVNSSDKLHPEYEKYYESLRSHLFEMLSHMKHSVPFFSPRYLGHMTADLLIPGLLGYFSGLLYNQNNIVEEAAPITLKLEVEAVKMIAKMLNLDIKNAWGHLCSGGTSANTESLWVARNVRLLPFQFGLAYMLAQKQQLDTGILNDIKIGNKASIHEVINNNLLTGLTVSESIELHSKIVEICGKSADFASLFNSCSVGNLGLMNFSSLCKEHLKSAWPKNFRMFVSRNAHYSIKKSAGVLGLGSEQIRYVSLDKSLRINTDELTEMLNSSAVNNEFILAVVGVFGSTEEGSTDDFEKLDGLRKSLNQNHSTDFWLHGDACYGGYALSMLHLGQEVDSPNEISTTSPNLGEYINSFTDSEIWPAAKAEQWRKAATAMSSCDSISIDPHKLGYIPYPAGAVFYKDYRVRELIRCDAPYLNAATQSQSNDQWMTPYLGKFTLEGSRPGAYGAATWLTHKTIPLDRSGHGHIVAETIAGTNELMRILKSKLTELETDQNKIAIKFLVDSPDLNILCYTFAAEVGKQKIPVAVLNKGLEALFDKLLPTEESHTQVKEFVVAMTSLVYEEYGEKLNELLAEWGIEGKIYPAREFGEKGNPWRDSDKLSFIRTVVMAPFLLGAKTKEKFQTEVMDLKEKYASFLAQHMPVIFESILQSRVIDLNPENEKKPRLSSKVLILEDDKQTNDYLFQEISGSFNGVDDFVKSARTRQDAEDFFNACRPEIATIDIDLGQNDQEGGLAFLREFLQYDTSKGAVLFSSLKKETIISRVGDIFQSNRVFMMEKPRPDLSKQRIMNNILEKLLDIDRLPV